MTIDVKGNLNGTEAPVCGERAAFIEEQSVDADAAYQRLAITRKTLAEFKVAINATNTADVVGIHKAAYTVVESAMRDIIVYEQQLIRQGK